MTARKLIQKFVEAHQGKIVTPYMAQYWSKERGWNYAVATLATAMRQMCPKQGGGAFIAVIKPREKSVQLTFA